MPLEITLKWRRWNLQSPGYTTGVCAMLPGMRWMVAMNDSNCNVAAIATAIQLLLSNAEK